jgi:hypothetical protein
MQGLSLGTPESKAQAVAIPALPGIVPGFGLIHPGMFGIMGVGAKGQLHPLPAENI